MSKGPIYIIKPIYMEKIVQKTSIVVMPEGPNISTNIDQIQIKKIALQRRLV